MHPRRDRAARQQVSVGGWRGASRVDPGCGTFAANGRPPWPPGSAASKALRQARYVVLNPVRKGLVADPLAWRWSTHRDVLGAVSSPWVTAARLAAATGREEQGFAAWWQGHVAREEGVPASARVLPAPARITPFPEAPLAAVAAASASSLRTRLDDVQRRGPTRELFLALARHVGWDRSAQLAAFCEIDPRSVQRARPRPPPDSLAAALVCLGDPRLLLP